MGLTCLTFDFDTNPQAERVVGSGDMWWGLELKGMSGSENLVMGHWDILGSH